MFLKNKFYFFILISSVGLTSSCDILGESPCMRGKGDTKTEVRDVPHFTGVDMRIAGEVYITEGHKTSVKIESFSNLLPEISTEVTGNNLVIRAENCLEYTDDETIVYITMPNIKNVELKSSGIVRVQTVPSIKQLNLTLSGSGTIRYLGILSYLNIQHSGSGDIILDGFVSHLNTNLSGSGSIKGYSLRSDTATVISTGSGDQQILVDQILEAQVTGSGNIYYKGHPYLVSTFTTGTGKVIKDN